MIELNGGVNDPMSGSVIVTCLWSVLHVCTWHIATQSERLGEHPNNRLTVSQQAFLIAYCYA